MVAITYGVARAAISATKGDETRKGLLARIYDAMLKARAKQAEREVARYSRIWQHEILAARGEDLPFDRR